MASAKAFENFLTAEQIAQIFELLEVQKAKASIDTKETGVVYFSIQLTDTLKHSISTYFGLNLETIDRIPMRWIKGDTAPHIDTGAGQFNNTYLAYLTTSDGELIIDKESYPIREGAAYVFPESLSHETRSTGSVPRLLLGPMSEAGFAVGGGNVIGGAGGTTLFVRQSGSDFESSDDQINWFPFPLPINVINTDTSAGVFTIEFTTDMTLTTANDYFICGSSHIQFGSSSLKTDGARPMITIAGVINYPGLIQNSDGHSNIYIYNLEVKSINESTLSNGEGDGAGWIAHIYFASGATNNYIINCSSDGPIAQFCGGIVGSWAGSNNGELTIIGCSSSGVSNTNSGGIAGTYAGRAGTLVCESCWTTGSIGNGGGGIVGAYGAISDGTLTITDCYSSGLIGSFGGGICGQESYGSITRCYSTGSCTSEGGCLGGKNTYCIYTNCYSTGSVLSTDAGGIVGPGGSPVTTNCYAVGVTVGGIGFIIGGSTIIPPTCFSESFNGTGGTWNTTNANTTLTGIPSPVIGTTWINRGLNQPFELRAMGYTPYSSAIITVTPALLRSHTASVVAGNSTAAAIVSDKSYVILETTGGSSDAVVSITINASTGAITVGSATTPGTYTLYVRNTGSYNISTVVLTITAPPCTNCTTPCCELPLFRRGPIPTIAMQTEIAAGNSLLGASRRGNLPYSALLAMRKAQASKR